MQARKERCTYIVCLVTSAIYSGNLTRLQAGSLSCGVSEFIHCFTARSYYAGGRSPWPLESNKPISDAHKFAEDAAGSAAAGYIALASATRVSI